MALKFRMLEEIKRQIRLPKAGIEYDDDLTQIGEVAESMVEQWTGVEIIRHDSRKVRAANQQGVVLDDVIYIDDEPLVKYATLMLCAHWFENRALILEKGFSHAPVGIKTLIQHGVKAA